MSPAQAKLSLTGIPHSPSLMSAILTPLSQAHIEVDMMVQHIDKHGKTDMSLTVQHKDYDIAYEIFKQGKAILKADDMMSQAPMGKLSLVGVGMRSNPHLLSRIFETLANKDIMVQLISTSEIKVSVVVEERHLEAGGRALHEAFQLGVLLS